MVIDGSESTTTTTDKISSDNDDKQFDFLIIYGSQTGQAESIAQQLQQRCRDEFRLTPRLQCMDKSEKEFYLEREKLVVIVCSSTGDGDPPDNASKFIRRLNRKTVPTNSLEGVTVALLGLGDSNYSTYQGVPKKLDKRLKELGATFLLPTAYADDEVGLDLVVEPWLDSLFSALLQFFNLPVDGIIIPVRKPEKNQKISSLSDQLAKTALTANSKVDQNQSITVVSEEMEEEYKAPEPILKLLEPLEGQPCLKKGSETLGQETELRVPVAQQQYLAASVTHEKILNSIGRWQNGCELAGAVGDIYHAPIVGDVRLSAAKAKKEKREVQLDLSEYPGKADYLPGDAFYFMFPNPREEVNYILKRINLLAVSDNKLDVVVRKKGDPTDQGPGADSSSSAAVPAHVHPTGATLRYLFTYCLDIRRAPGRPLLRVFADSAKDASEKRRLLELCSAQGVQEFTALVRKAGVSLADLLHAFPSVIPPVERLIELLPRLMPRPYSVASAQSRWGDRVRFVYSLMQFPAEEGRLYARTGLCTGWLSGLRVGDTVPIMLKEPARFRIPSEPANVPILMIGPGTGVAPFLGFLQEILNEHVLGKTCPAVQRWLYFGCRDTSQDFIYRHELESYAREKILSRLVVCESQPDSGAEGRCPDCVQRYVQDALLANGKEVAEFLIATPACGRKSVIFVCGDAKGMSKGVWNAFVEILTTHADMTLENAQKFLVDLKESSRYIEDVWS